VGRPVEQALWVALPLSAGDTVLDIGCNDGTLLASYNGDITPHAVAPRVANVVFQRFGRQRVRDRERLDWVGMSRALIFGVSGQDGAYLARCLLGRGYEVHGTSRDADVQPFERLKRLGLRDQVTLHSVSLLDFRNLLQVMDAVRPDEIYNLAGQTSVALSFLQPVGAMESVAVGTLNVLEIIRASGRSIRYYNASSSESFGNLPEGTSADEQTPFRPRSPYATAKASAHWLTANYREAYGLFACSGLLFNHESPLRPRRFVTAKIMAAARALAAGERMKLELGNLDVSRDWGYAPEYVEAMWLMLQQDHPDDYVIATGESHTLREFTDGTFRRFGLDYRDHVEVSEALRRPSEIVYNRGKPLKAHERMGWRARTHFQALLDVLVEDRFEPPL
jgi:GDPmannose 4,6-dehydratase